MKPLDLALGLYLLAVNLAAFLCYGLDKRRARKRQWRIPEASLLTLAFAGGAAGAWAGMWVFRHKTRKTKFRILVPLALGLWLGLLIVLWKGGSL